MARFTKTVKDREYAEIVASYDNKVSVYLAPDFGNQYYEVISVKQARKIGQALLIAADEAEAAKKEVKAAKKEGK